MRLKFTVSVIYILFLALALVACGQGALLPLAASATPTRQARPVAPLLEPTGVVDLASLPIFQPILCPFILPEDYVQGENVDCGYLLVPERRADPDSRAIRLAVAIFHPPGGASNPDPIFYLSGGPGASALELIRFQFEEVFAQVMQASGRDLVVFDQRGVGLSKPALDCPQLSALIVDLMDRQVDDRQVDDRQAGELALQAIRDCRKGLAAVADLAAYNSVTSAADVEDLRLALGYGRINLWAGSYGTRLGLEMMRLYPEGLRAVVLDAVYPPDVDLYLESPANLDRALELLFESCAANPVCDESFPDLRSVFYDTLARLEAAPVMRQITNIFNGDEYDALMDGDALLGLVFQVLYESRWRYLLPQMIYEVSQGDFEVFDQIRGAIIGQLDISSRGMMFSVQCHEELVFSSAEEFKASLRAYPHLASMYEYAIVGKLAYRACEFWGAGRAAPIANQAVSSDIPTLLMAGEFDPITPPAWAEHAAQTLENGYVFVYPGVGHGATALPGCPREMLLAFWRDPGRAPDDACILEMQD